MRLHEEQVMAIETITVDPALWECVRKLSPGGREARSVSSRRLVFPVVSAGHGQLTTK